MDKIVLVLANTKHDYKDNIKILKKLKKNCKLFVESGVEFSVHKMTNKINPELIKYAIYTAPTLYFIANDLKLNDIDEIKDFIDSLKEKCHELKNQVATPAPFENKFDDDEISKYRNNVQKNFEEQPIEWGLGSNDENEMDKNNMEKLMSAEISKRGLSGSHNRIPSSGGKKNSKNRFENCKNDAEIAAVMYGLDD